MPAASVVLVEDSVPYARLVELILADAVPGGVEVRHHDTVADARADLRERGADCILLDFGLPDANGLEALTLVLEVAGGAPVIVLSGHDDMELATAAIRAGAQDYLVKGQERPSALVPARDALRDRAPPPSRTQRGPAARQGRSLADAHAPGAGRDRRD